MLVKEPPDILITTPESLYLMLTSAARESLRGVETLILDEVHAVAGTKRGAHLALSVERLQRLVEHPIQRIGLSATQRPLEEIGKLRLRRPADRARRRGRRARSSTCRSSFRSRTCASSARRASLSTRCSPTARSPTAARARRRLDLAVDVPGAARPRRGAPLDDRLRQQPAARRAARAAAQRARRARDRARAPRQPCARAARADRGGPESGPDPVPRRHLVARARNRHGRRRPRDPGRVAEVGRARPAAHRPRRARARRGLEGPDLPEVPGRPARVRRRRPARCANGEIEETKIPRNPLDVLAQQIVAICGRRGDRGRRAARPRPRRLSVRRPLARAARERPRHARRAAIRPTSSPSCGRGSSGIARAASIRGARRRAAARRHERGHDSRPRPVRRLPASTAAAASASSTRRWCTRRAPARRSCSAPRPGGSRRSPATACSSRRRPGVPGAVPFWKGEGVGRPYELGEKIGAASRELSALGDDAALDRLRSDFLLDERAAPNLLAFLRDQARRHRRRPVGPHHRRRALPRRDRRLARLHPHAVRRPRARAVGDGDRRTAARVARDRGAVDLVGRRDRDPSSRTPTRRRRPTMLLLDAAEVEDLVVAEVGQTGALRRALPRERRARAPDPAAAARPANAALAAAAEGAVACSRSPASTRSSRSCSRRTASASRTSSTCRR